MKQLTFDDRLQIQKGLTLNKSYSQIAKDLGKNRTSVSREVQAHLQEKGKPARSKCIHHKECIFEDKSLCPVPNCTKNVAFAHKTLEELDSSVEEKQKSDRKFWLIPIAMVVFGICLLLVGGLLGDDESDKEQTTVTTTEEQSEIPTQESTKPTTVPTTEKSRLDDVHDTTKTATDSYGNMPSYIIYTMAERNEKNKEIFIDDAKILIANYTGCSEKKGGELIEQDIERGYFPDEPDYGVLRFRKSVKRL